MCCIIFLSNIPFGRLSFIPYSHLQYELCILCTSPWQQTFPVFIISSNFVISPVFKIIWLFTLKNVRLQNLKLIFPVILQMFDLESHGQTSVKVELVMFGLVFMKFRKLITQIFLLFKSFPILWASSIGQKLFSKN